MLYFYTFVVFIALLLALLITSAHAMQCTTFIDSNGQTVMMCCTPGPMPVCNIFR